VTNDEDHQVVAAVADAAWTPATAGQAGIALAPPHEMQRRLWWAYPLALIGIGAIWGAVLQVLMGRQVAALVADPQAEAGRLGLVVSVGAVVAVVAQPVLGRLSDRTRVPFLGRRNVWILGGAAVSVIALLATALTTNLVLLAVAWAVAIIPLSGVQAALTAVLPERVPLSRRGTMSGLVGMSQVIGGVIGVGVASLAGSVVVGYAVLAAFLMATCALFALVTRDAPAPVMAQARSAAGGAAAGRVPGLRTHPDYWWTFFGRFMMLLAYFFIASFGLYLLRDYIEVGDGTIEDASRALAPAAAVAALLTLVFALVGGLLVDRFGRVRIFVAIASLIFVPSGVVLFLVPTYPGFLVALAILGVAFGIYTAVDQVLITRVLPDNGNAARDLGILNIANAGPQVIAPVLAGSIISLTGNYRILFVIMILLAATAATSVRFINSVP
jgi:MFS family permease